MYLLTLNNNFAIVLKARNVHFYLQRNSDVPFRADCSGSADEFKNLIKLDESVAAQNLHHEPYQKSPIKQWTDLWLTFEKLRSI